MNEYKYINDMPVNEGRPVGTAPVITLMDKSCAMAHEALLMTRKINSCLFGVGTPDEKLASPSCLAEAIDLQTITLTMLLEELTRMSVGLGM